MTSPSETRNHLTSLASPCLYKTAQIYFCFLYSLEEREARRREEREAAEAASRAPRPPDAAEQAHVNVVELEGEVLYSAAWLKKVRNKKNRS